MKFENPLKIAVIDSYVNTGLLKRMVKKVSLISEKESSKNMHGTIVTAKILEEYPEADLTCIEILAHNNKCSVEKLMEGLTYILTGEFDIVNMSLGIESCSSATVENMQSIIDLILKKGTVLFAAGSNHSQQSYPSDLKGVIKIDYISNDQGIWNINTDKNHITFFRNSISFEANSLQSIYRGNSYLCPFITGIFCWFVSLHSCKSPSESISDFFGYLNLLQTNYSQKLFYDIRMETLVNNRCIFLKGESSVNLKAFSYLSQPDEIFNISKMLSGKAKRNDIANLGGTLIIDHFAGINESETNYLKHIIVELSKSFEQIIMYSNYFHLEERVNLVDRQNIMFHNVFL